MKIRNIKDTIDILYGRLNEADITSDRGAYFGPLVPGLKDFKKSQLAPFVDNVSKFDDAELAYDSYDGKLDVSKKKSMKMEKRARRMTKFLDKHPELTGSDDDGNAINAYELKKVMEASTSVTSGPYTGPIEIGMKKWSKSELGPFDQLVNTEANRKKIKSKLKNNIKKKVGVWEKGKDGKYDIDTHDTHTIKEDLGVWFGTKKKPKGSKQPKGPWVNICRKKEGGGHPPCGRPEADSKGYPKCRAAGVASKMTDSQKKSACQQKRKAEKTHSKTGTGNKPKMVSYKPKKKKSQNESIIIDAIIKSLNK